MNKFGWKMVLVAFLGFLLVFVSCDTGTNGTTEETKYTITFNPDGGTVNPTSITVPEGNTVSNIPTPSRNNYNFLGWFTELNGNGIKFTATTVVNSSYTVYANWEVIDPKAVYYGNWNWEYMTVSISSNQFHRYDNDDGSSLTIVLTSWQEIVNNTGNSVEDYPNGYSISGTCTESTSFLANFFSVGQEYTYKIFLNKNNPKQLLSIAWDNGDAFLTYVE